MPKRLCSCRNTDAQKAILSLRLERTSKLSWAGKLGHESCKRGRGWIRKKTQRRGHETVVALGFGGLEFVLEGGIHFAELIVLLLRKLFALQKKSLLIIGIQWPFVELEVLVELHRATISTRRCAPT
jgi:hypothetical protein